MATRITRKCEGANWEGGREGGREGGGRVGGGRGGLDTKVGGGEKVPIIGMKLKTVIIYIFDFIQPILNVEEGGTFNN